MTVAAEELARHFHVKGMLALIPSTGDSPQSDEWQCVALFDQDTTTVVM